MLLFVYGTLLQKAENHHLIEGEARFVGRGFINAVLYDLKVGFPAAVLDRGKVYGEVYDADEDLVEEIDEFEGYYPKRPADCLYFRKPLPVFMSDGSKLEAEVYYMTPESLEKFPAEIMPRGRWVK